MSVKIITIGAAVQDVFLQGAIFKGKREKGEIVEEFNLGDKYEIDNVTISTGGGATNAAVTFARQGLHACFMGVVGEDISARIVLDDLHKEGVDTSLVMHNPELGTGYSTILLSPSGERTIITYRGASKNIGLHAKDFHDMNADWIYISSLSGDVASLKTIVDYAREHEIKIAVNPGKGEIEHIKQIKELLSSFAILSLNVEEMEGIFGKMPPKKLLAAATQYVPTVLMTDGPKGAYASDGVHMFKAGVYEDVKVVDRAGAGDAFSSGFVSVIAQGGSIESALTLASANSTSVVSKIGAKAGILKEGVKLHHMPIEVTNL